MAFFGLFKSKEERQLEDSVAQIMERAFRNGEVDISRDCERVDVLTHRKIAADKLRGFVAGCKTLVLISESENERRFVDSFVARSDGKISEKEAYDMYVYLEGEAGYYDKMSKLMGGIGVSVGESILREVPWIYSEGVYTDEIPAGYGEYGLVASNPVPTISVRGSHQYLTRLRFSGRPVETERVGSTSSDVTPGSVDMYRLSVSGRDVGTVYICPYHKRNSRRAPKGFSLVSD